MASNFGKPNDKVDSGKWAKNTFGGGGGVLPRQRMSASVNRALNNTLKGLDFVIDKTWDGNHIDHEPYSFHMEWCFQRLPGKPHKRVVKVMTEGPLMDEPDPPDDLGGRCENLWDYEVIELFFANDKDQYLEVEIGPHGHWLVYLLNGKRNVVDKGEDFEIDVQNTFEGQAWRSIFEIPLAFFPPNVTKFNAYAIHGHADNRKYCALYPVTDGYISIYEGYLGTHTEPDFHRLEFFQKIDISRIMPQGFNDMPFADHRHGNPWQTICT